MPDRLTGFDTPTFEELLEQTHASYANALGTNPMLRRGVAPTLAHVDAMMAAGFFGYLDWIAAQTLPLWAEGPNLDAWGTLFGLPRRAAIRATGEIVVTGAPGARLPAGALLSAPDGPGDTLYTTDHEAVVRDGPVRVRVTAREPGPGANREPGSRLVAVETVPGVDTTLDIVSLGGGATAEADGRPGVLEGYRGRILERLRAPPQGGSVDDHIRWVKSTPGVPVTRVWVRPATRESNTVWVRFMTDGATPDGIPTPAHVERVAAWLEQHRPVTETDLRVVAPVPVRLDLVIYGLVPDTPGVRRAVADEIADVLLRRASPGCSVLPGWIVEAVSVAPGEDSHRGISLLEPVHYAGGEIPVLGTIEFAT